MPLPDATLLEAFSLAELRDLVGVLVAEVEALRVGAEAQQATIAALRAENQALRDEVARLKGVPPRPPLRPSGMEKATEPGAVEGYETLSAPTRCQARPGRGDRRARAQGCGALGFALQRI